MVAPYFDDMGIPCPIDTDPADFYVDFLSDPELVWSRFQSRPDVVLTADQAPPLTTSDLMLHFHAFMHRQDWKMMAQAAPPQGMEDQVRLLLLPLWSAAVARGPRQRFAK